MKLIDKDALVAEIERRIKEYQSTGDDYWFPVIENLKSILSFLDTLGVKEMNLEKEINTQWNKFVDSEGEVEQFSEIAKHFFELGMLVNNKAQKGE